MILCFDLKSLNKKTWILRAKSSLKGLEHVLCIGVEQKSIPKAHRLWFQNQTKQTNISNKQPRSGTIKKNGNEKIQARGKYGNISNSVKKFQKTQNSSYFLEKGIICKVGSRRKKLKCKVNVNNILNLEQISEETDLAYIHLANVLILAHIKSLIFYVFKNYS